MIFCVLYVLHSLQYIFYQTENKTTVKRRNKIIHPFYISLSIIFIFFEITLVIVDVGHTSSSKAVWSCK
jgi:hypothetical protein